MMPQRKDKNDKTGHSSHDEFLELLTLLESSDQETVESVKNMIQENLYSSKDSKLLNNVVEFYVATQSKMSLEILLHVRDPHDKHLFEKINDMMKNENARYNALQLLGTIVYKQPSWLHKISNQRVMHTLLNMLKTDVNAPNLLSGLFILICVLSMIPHQFGSLLPDTFDIFSRLAAWNVKKPNTLSDTLNLHLQTGIYSLFHRLYGMFPCNFLAYLRSFYGGRDCSEDNFKVFSLVIKPMLERVRLHPLLVTASKEAELNVNRWKKMAYHDIIVDCASISLDTIEGTLENLKRMNLSISGQSEKVSSYESVSSINFHFQSDTSVTIESVSALNETAPVNQENIWSPSQTCDTPTQSCSSNNMVPLEISKGEWEFKYAMQSSTEENIPFDLAIEAKPELLKSDFEKSSMLLSKARQMSSQNSTDSENGKCIISADGKEEDIDYEVSELTSTQVFEQNIDEIRQDTPFCSTTQNLTDEPANLASTLTSLSGRSDSLTKSIDDDVDEMYNSMPDTDVQPYVPTFTRYRYFSHCGSPPKLVPIIKKPKAIRSISCPAKLCPIPQNSLIEVKNCNDKNITETAIVTCNSDIMTNTTSAFVSLTNESSMTATVTTLPVYKQLLPAVVNPLQGFEQPIIIGLHNDQSETNNTKHLSPTEILDLYIQKGSASYLNSLPLTSTKDTDWTHFGGKPPPEEIDVLRNQVLLLHSMLLFERHRKDIHSERNRRILGRAKRARMHEEYVEALKTEIVILTEENENLKTELSNQHKVYQQLHNGKKKLENELESKHFKIGQENTQLSFTKRELQFLLVSQKEENDEVHELYKKAQSDLANIKCQLKYARREVQQCQKVRREAIFLTKQLILLQELNAQYKTKIEQKEPAKPDARTKLMNNSMLAEIAELKQKLEKKSVILDFSKGKIAELENMLSNMKLKLKEKTSFCQAMKSYHQAEITAREERIDDLKKISSQKDAHILQLYADLENLKETIESLKKKMPNSATTNSECSSSNGLQPSNVTGCDIISTDQRTYPTLS